MKAFPRPLLAARALAFGAALLGLALASGCGGSKTEAETKAARASAPAAPERKIDFKIGIMTGTVSQGEDEFRAAQMLTARFGEEHIKHVTYPDNFMNEQETVIAQLVGLAELVRGAEKKGEMAFSVRPDRRGQKIGTRLMHRLLLRATMCGVRKVFVMFLSDNAPMRKMASRAGMSVSSVDGEAQAERELPAPSAEELTRWFIEEGLAHGGYFSTLGMARWGSLVSSSMSATRERIAALAPAV